MAGLNCHEVVSSRLGSWPRPELLRVPIHKLFVTGPWWGKELVSECISMYSLLPKENLATKKNPKHRKTQNPTFNNMIVSHACIISWRTSNEKINGLAWSSDHTLSGTCLDSPQFPQSYGRVGLDHRLIPRHDPPWQGSLATFWEWWIYCCGSQPSLHTGIIWETFKDEFHVPDILICLGRGVIEHLGFLEVLQTTLMWSQGWEPWVSGCSMLMCTRILWRACVKYISFFF